jgi:phosphoribosylamine--glycine ligase|tara:strand:- start:217 stop:1488 length:1272 start_codon:yes stop_codon:yes gene_type:complete
MNVLILGSGGREHAFAYKISQSELCKNLYVAPGNSGTREIASNLEIQLNQFEKIAEAIKNLNVSLVVVGPEVPLVNGLTDFINGDNDLKDIIVIGPNKYAAQLEGSKDFAKDFLNRHNIPTASHKTFTAENINDAFSYIDEMKAPYVLKADGLAAGKGVLIIANPNEAKNEIHEMLINSKFGDASKSVVVEEFLDGIELSCFVITDGKDYKLLPSAKDYKRIGEGDTGLNTGGMGAVSPPTFLTKEFTEKVEKQVIQPTIEGLKKDNINYQGFIFFGLIKVNDDPYVIEYNVRMGDPESEVVLPRIKSDLLELLYVAGNGNLKDHKILIDDKKAATVFLVSGGYPEQYEKNKEIFGLDSVIDSLVFHAGAKYEDGKVKTNGGRVIAITSIGNSVEEALEKSYKSIKKINFEKMNYRKDIGFDL